MPVNHTGHVPSSTKDSQHLLDKSSLIDKSLLDKSLLGDQSHGGERSSYRGESREAIGSTGHHQHKARILKSRQRATTDQVSGATIDAYA